jgi:hypothetical protein
VRTRDSRTRVGAGALALLAVGLLAACGGGGDAAGTTSTTAASPTVSPTAGTDDGAASPEHVFSAESPWNTEVTGAPIAASSDELLAASKIRTSVGSDGLPTEVLNTREWTTPIVADGEPTVLTCRQQRCGDGVGGKDITLAIPADVDPDPLHDGWFTVLDQRTRTGYDLWRARREDDGTISYHFLRTWDLDGPGFNQPYVVSARGSGLPLFGGVIRAAELERGRIDHALAISIPGPRAGVFLQPASSTDGNNANQGSLPEGARIRLKADVALPLDPDQVTRARAIVAALKRYGAIIVDRAAAPTLYVEKVAAESDRPPLLLGYELLSLGLDDFEVVDYRDQKRYRYPPEGVDPSRLEPVGGVGSGSGTDSGVPSSRAPGAPQDGE